MSAAVDIASAAKTYPNGTRALEPVKLTVTEGEFVTLLGPSGCGKSTLLKMVAGLLAPSEGAVALWGAPVEQAERSGHRLSFVFQEATLMPWARVQGNVRLPLDLAGVAREAADARVALPSSWSGWRSVPTACRASCRAACRCACRLRVVW